MSRHDVIHTYLKTQVDKLTITRKQVRWLLLELRLALRKETRPYSRPRRRRRHRSWRLHSGITNRPRQAIWLTSRVEKLSWRILKKRRTRQVRAWCIEMVHRWRSCPTQESNCVGVKRVLIAKYTSNARPKSAMYPLVDLNLRCTLFLARNSWDVSRGQHWWRSTFSCIIRLTFLLPV